MLVRADDLVATPRHGVYKHCYHVSALTNVVEEAIIPWLAEILNDPPPGGGVCIWPICRRRL